MEEMKHSTRHEVWSSDEDEGCNSNEPDKSRLDLDLMARKDWGKIESNIEVDSYREGLQSNQEEALQKGLNIAFAQSFEMAMAAGRLQGEICARLQNSYVPSSSSIQNDENLVSPQISEEAAVKSETQILNDTNNKVSSLISRTPSQLCHKYLEEKQCCGALDADMSCLCKRDSCQVEAVEDSGCDSSNFTSRKNTEFWIEFESLKSHLSSHLVS